MFVATSEVRVVSYLRDCARRLLQHLSKAKHGLLMLLRVGQASCQCLTEVALQQTHHVSESSSPPRSLLLNIYVL